MGSRVSTDVWDDLELFTLINCLRDVKLDFSQPRTVTFTPKGVESLDSIMPWSTLSKVADRSSTSKITEMFLSTAVTISF